MGDQRDCDVNRPFWDHKETKPSSVPTEDESTPISWTSALMSAPLLLLVVQLEMLISPYCSFHGSLFRTASWTSQSARGNLKENFTLAGRCASCDPMHAHVAEKRFKTGDA